MKVNPNLQAIKNFPEEVRREYRRQRSELKFNIFVVLMIGLLLSLILLMASDIFAEITGITV